MTQQFAPTSWTLRCHEPDCTYRLIVNPRGARGRDPGAGVEAAQTMNAHARSTHPDRPLPYPAADDR